MKTIRVLLADDHAMVRMGLASLLGTTKDICVVGEAENGVQTVEKALALKPDIVLMDLMMPEMDGIDATAEIHARLPDVKILVLTSSGSSDDIARALKAGASGALLKSSDFSTLVSALRTTAEGKSILSTDVRRNLDKNPPLPDLTPRQAEILASVTKGLTNADIARLLGIRESSVKEHVNLICEKLGAANRAEAVAIALRRHLLKI